jgi:hypothetical protein
VVDDELAGFESIYLYLAELLPISRCINICLTLYYICGLIEIDRRYSYYTPVLILLHTDINSTTPEVPPKS